MRRPGREMDGSGAVAGSRAWGTVAAQALPSVAAGALAIGDFAVEGGAAVAGGVDGTDVFALGLRRVAQLGEEGVGVRHLGGGFVHRRRSVGGEGDLPTLSLGQRVSHPLFGEGVILNAEGSGERARVQVSFEGEGDKWLVLGFAKLTPL